MKSAPAAIASTDAWRIRSYEPSSPVSRITLRCASPAASRAAAISSKHGAYCPPRKYERLRTMSTSCAPRSTTSRISASRAPSGPRPEGTRRRRSRPSRSNPSVARARPAPGADTGRRPRPPGSTDRPGSGGRPRAHRDDLADGIRALERGEVHAPDREIERPQLRLALDRALRERGRPLLEPDGVHRGHAGEQLEASFGAYSARPARERSISAAWDIARHGTSLTHVLLGPVPPRRSFRTVAGCLSASRRLGRSPAPAVRHGAPRDLAFQGRGV